MTNAPTPEPPKRRNAFTRFLDTVEWLGNFLPHPVTLFAVLAVGIVLLSGIFGWIGLAIEDPRPAGTRGVAEDGMIRAVSLLNAEGIRMIFTNLVANFTSFAVGRCAGRDAGRGCGRAFWTFVRSGSRHGLVSASTRRDRCHRFCRHRFEHGFRSRLRGFDPPSGPFSIARSASVGRDGRRLRGVSGGYSANVLIGTIDPLLAGITQEAARLIDPDYVVVATANWYFMVASTFLITLVGSLVSIFIVEPKLGKYDSSAADPTLLDKRMMERLSGDEKKGLLWALIALIGVLGLMALTLVPEWGVFRNPETGDRINSPFFRGFVVWILIFFIATGYAYGRAVGTMRTDRDVIDAMAKALASLGLYIVLVFFAAQFVAFFGWTNLGAISAVTGAEFLKETGMTGPMVFIFFILMCAVINLSLGSASAQWAVTAPIFVPMLMLIDMRRKRSRQPIVLGIPPQTSSRP